MRTIQSFSLKQWLAISDGTEAGKEPFWDVPPWENNQRVVRLLVAVFPISAQMALHRFVIYYSVSCQTFELVHVICFNDTENAWNELALKRIVQITSRRLLSEDAGDSFSKCERKRKGKQTRIRFVRINNKKGKTLYR